MKNKKDCFIADVPTGQLNFLVKELAKQIGTKDPFEVIRQIRCGKSRIEIPKWSWYEKNDLIYLDITFNGWTGLDWLTSFDLVGPLLDNGARNLINSKGFIPSEAKSATVAIMRGRSIRDDKDLFYDHVCGVAQSIGWNKPGFDVACLVHSILQSQDVRAMDLEEILFMHRPLKADDEKDFLLKIKLSQDKKSTILSHEREEGRHYRRSQSFAFVVNTK